MVVARDGYGWFNSRGPLEEYGRYNWRMAVQSLDWNRVLLEAKGLHLATEGVEDVCGECIMQVLLKEA